MTRAQGEKLTQKMTHLDREVAKLQRVRHDMEVLLVGQVRDLFDRLARLESQLVSLRDNFFDGSSKNLALVEEIQTLRNQLEHSEYRYKHLEEDTKSLAQNQQELKKLQEKMYIPPKKKEHYTEAKAYFKKGAYKKSKYLLEEFIKDYPKDNELLGQSYYLLGEIYRKWGEGEKAKTKQDKNFKNSYIYYQKITELYKKSILKEEALFKMGVILKKLGKIQEAKAAFNKLLDLNSKSNRAEEAKKYRASL